MPLTPEELQLSRGESLRDTAQVLSRYLDALAIRTFAHAELEEWAEWATIPVINALTAVEHPCQALADALTIRERLGSLDGVRVAWVGDGTNVLVSLAALGELLGYEVVAACPEGYEPPRRRRSSATRARPSPAPTSSSPTSGSAWARRTSARSGCSTSSRTASTRSCSRRRHRTRSSCTACRRIPGEEITAEVLYGDRSAVWDEAENRLHVQKALLALLLGAR